MTNKKEMSSSEWMQLVLGIAILFGALVRFLPGGMAGFPLNDGGMFLSMIHDLQESRYSLPEFTSYNQLSIPYAYPPFGFYVARTLSDVLNLPALTLLHWLPPLVNTLSILAFYLLASDLLKSKLLGALASAFYAVTPGAFGWFVMGGGLTRSFGSLFLLLSVLSVLRLFQTGRGKFIGLSILLCGLTVLSHPEAGVHTAATCMLVWIFFGRTIRSFIHALVVGLGVLLATFPWWGMVLSYHGFAPFLSALNSGSYGTPLSQAMLGAVLGGDGFLPVMALLRITGLVWGIWKKEYFLVAWAVLPYLVEPRSAPSVAFYPLSMLAALAFAQAIPYLISRLRRVQEWNEPYKNNLYNGILFLILIYLFIESGLYGFRLVNNSLKPADLEAMMWIKENTNNDGNFLLLTGVISPEIDPFVEWFPALTERRSLSTVQGYEWLGAGKFTDYYSDLAQLQRCDSAECVEEWSLKTGLEFKYIVIQTSQVEKQVNEAFAESSNYLQLYDSGKVQVYSKSLP